MVQTAHAGGVNLKSARIEIVKKYVTRMTFNRAKNITREVEAKPGVELRFSSGVAKDEHQPAEVQIDEPFEFKLIVSKVEPDRIELSNPDPESKGVSWSPIEKDGQVKSIKPLTASLVLTGHAPIYVTGGPVDSHREPVAIPPNKYSVFYVVRRIQ